LTGTSPDKTLGVKLKPSGGISVDGDGLYLTETPASLSRYIVREVPSGTKNNSNKIFTLAHTPVAGTEMLFVNGILQNYGATEDYTISGGTLTINDAPKAADVLLVTYWY
jgi:hypothetical protein